MSRKLLGPAHPRTLMVQSNLGELLRQKGELGAALELLEEAVELYSKTPGADRLLVAGCRSNHGAVLTELRRFEEAGRELLAAYSAFEEAVGRDHNATREAAMRLERLGKLWGDPAFAASVRELMGRGDRPGRP
jgi:tetratricopeptide (TPR) repeat protein